METCLYKVRKLNKKCFYLHGVMPIASFMLVKALDARKGMGRLFVGSGEWEVGGG